MLRQNRSLSKIFLRLFIHSILLFSITACSNGTNPAQEVTFVPDEGSNSNRLNTPESPDGKRITQQPAKLQNSPNPTSTPAQTQESEGHETGVCIPAQSDWVDHGIILESGEEGEWDYYLWGGFAFSIVKKGDVFFLYYQGSSDYRTEYDETVLWRAIGVATSNDGVHFRKHENNPVITWFPNKNGEEGAVSSGVTMGENQEIFLYYGANTEESPTTVNADIRLVSSLDGLSFSNLGSVLDHKNGSVWGSGDELFPIDAIYDEGKWIVYYIPNGTPESGLLGIAYGNQPTRLTKSLSVTNNGKTIPVWGTAGHVRLDEEEFALILNNVREKRTEVRLSFFDSPSSISEPVAIYQFEEVQQAVILLDRQMDTWFMYYRTNDNRYGVKLAPVRENNTSPASPLCP